MLTLKGILKPALAAAFLTLAPLAAVAATISGQIGITGTINVPNSTFSIGGGVDLNDPGDLTYVSGDFAVLVPALGAVALTDIVFASPGEIWSVGGFSFEATSFSNIYENVNNSSGFTANGVVKSTDVGLDDTNGTLIFSTQNISGTTTVTFSSTTVVPLPAAGFLLLGALGGLGLMRRRRKAA